jgi:hypothetical protein
VPTQKPRTTIYLEPELFEALQDRAKEEKRTVSNLSNLLIEQAMKAWLVIRDILRLALNLSISKITKKTADQRSGKFAIWVKWA